VNTRPDYSPLFFFLLLFVFVLFLFCFCFVVFSSVFLDLYVTAVAGLKQYLELNQLDAPHEPNRHS